MEKSRLKGAIKYLSEYANIETIKPDVEVLFESVFASDQAKKNEFKNYEIKHFIKILLEKLEFNKEIREDFNQKEYYLLDHVLNMTFWIKNLEDILNYIKDDLLVIEYDFENDNDMLNEIKNIQNDIREKEDQNEFFRKTAKVNKNLLSKILQFEKNVMIFATIMLNLYKYKINNTSRMTGGKRKPKQKPQKTPTNPPKQKTFTNSTKPTKSEYKKTDEKILIKTDGKTQKLIVYTKGERGIRYYKDGSEYKLCSEIERENKKRERDCKEKEGRKSTYQKKNVKNQRINKKEKKMKECTLFLRDGCKWKRICMNV